MIPYLSTSAANSINLTDVLKSLRTGFLTLCGAFVTASVQSALGLVQSGVFDRKVLLSSAALAGVTACFDLVRRYLTNYGALQK